MSRVLTAMDLFAGAGGLSLGLEAAGFTTVAAVEVDSDAVCTYRRNLPSVDVMQADVRTVSFRQFAGVDLIAGGPPCQPFSSGGRRRGREDERDFLPEFVRAVLEAKPRAFLLENVPGLASPSHAAYLRDTIAPLLDYYTVSGPHILNAADYGVPQSRKRIVLVGLWEGQFRLPPRKARHVPAGAYISPVPVGPANPSRITYAKNPDLRPNPYHGQLFNGGGRGIELDFPAPTILASAGGNKTHFVDVGKQVPAYHRYLMQGGRPLVGELPEARRLTVEESALLQTFPEGMEFVGSRSSRYRQVGNAVPVLMAKALGAAIAEQLGRAVLRRQAV